MSRKYVEIKSMVLVGLIFALMAGCSAAGYGSLRRDSALTAVFENALLMEDYRYYYTGPAGRPDAIVGLRSPYELVDSGYWHDIDLTPARLREWIREYESTAVFFNPNFASYVYDANGVQVGIWYSHAGWTTVKNAGDHGIVIYAPTENKYRRSF